MWRSTRRGTRPPRRPMKRTRTPRSLRSSRRRSSSDSLNAHEEAHLVERAAPVLGRERVHGHPLQPDLERALDGVEERLLARRVAVGALQAPPLRPAPVAVHDDRDVTRHARRIDALDHGRRLPIAHRRAAGARSGDRAAATIPRRCAGRRSSTRRRAAVAPAAPPRAASTRSARTRRRGPRRRPTPTTASAQSRARRSTRGDGVVACGGDGTVAVLAGVAAESGGTIAVVPTGAGNDFARHLGIDPRRPLARGRPARPRADRVGRPRSRHDRRRHERMVHDGREHRLRRRGQPLGERRALLTGTPLYVAAIAAHGRGLPTPAGRRARRRATSGTVARGSSRSGTRAATPAG